MRFLPLTIAIVLAVTSTAVTAFQTSPDYGNPPPGGSPASSGTYTGGAYTGGSGTTSGGGTTSGSGTSSGAYTGGGTTPGSGGTTSGGGGTPGSGGTTPGGGGTTGGGGGTTPGGGGPAPWRFSHPDDGMQCYSEVAFIGVGPQNSVGGLSLYSYDNQVQGGVYASELTLQIAVLVDTDPGIDWVGPSWALQGSYYATIMPALSSLNMALLSLSNPGAVSGEVYTLVQVNGGQGVQFSIVDP